MGTRIVFKHNGNYYIYSDLNLWITSSKVNSESSLIYPLENGLVVALQKRNNLGQMFYRELKKLSCQQVEKINTEFIINHIIKPVLDSSHKENILNEKNQEMDNTVYVVTKDKIYQIIKTFYVIEATFFASAGIEEGIIYTSYLIDKKTDVFSICRTINRNLFRLIDTIEKNYVVYDVNQNNYNFFGEDIL